MSMTVDVDVRWVRCDYRPPEVGEPLTIVRTFYAGCGHGTIGGAPVGKLFAVRSEDERWLSTRQDCLTWLIQRGLPLTHAEQLLAEAEQVLEA